MKSAKIYNYLLEHRHPIFLIGLLSFFIIPEILNKVLGIPFPFPIQITILILTSMLLIQASPKKRFLSYGFVVVLIAFIIISNNYKDTRELESTAWVFLFAYFSFITFYLFRDLMRSKKVTTSVIIGAFAGYFMIGVIGFFIFAFLDSQYPDTISVDMGIKSGVEDMFYFSFVTLTTIGYGDFSPISSLGQKIAILQGLIGQFYLAIVMAILVGKFLSHNPND